MQWRSTDGHQAVQRARTYADLEKNVRPASNLADCRSVGAMIVLNASKQTGFQNIGSFWITEIMQKGLVFCDTVFNKHFVSLGVHAGGGLSWELLEIGGTDYLSFGELMEDIPATLRLQTFTMDALTLAGDSTDEVFQGVPTRVCYGLSCVR